MDSSTRFCENCGTPLAEETKFCEACGAPVSAGPAASQPSGEVSQPKPPTFRTPPASELPAYLSPTAAPPPNIPLPNYQEPPRKRGLSGWIITCIILLVLVCCVVVVAGFLMLTNSDFLNQFSFIQALTSLS